MNFYQVILIESQSLMRFDWNRDLKWLRDLERKSISPIFLNMNVSPSWVLFDNWMLMLVLESITFLPSHITHLFSRGIIFPSPTHNSHIFWLWETIRAPARQPLIRIPVPLHSHPLLRFVFGPRSAHPPQKTLVFYFHRNFFLEIDFIEGDLNIFLQHWRT